MSQQVLTKERPQSGYIKNPDYKLRFEPSPRRVRCSFNGETIADSTSMRLLYEPKHLPVYYFPREAVRLDLLTRTEHSTYCLWKGDASYWTIDVAGKSLENSVWTYEDPYPEIAEIKNFVSFYWGRMDHWYEEDEEVFVHPRDPYHRIDVVDSKRPVKVVLGGEAVAETRRARFLFETSLPTRYYIPREDVRTELLEPSPTTTVCPYKGIASYYSARIDGALHEDIVWYYPDPIAESPKLKDLLCFYNENVDDIFVDGQAIPNIKTKWSRK